jgi:Protein of unknown function (DUF2971)
LSGKEKIVGCAAEYLYRYRPLDGDGLRHLEATLLKGDVFFSSPNAFNDPFDCHPVYSYGGTDEEMHNHLRNRYSDDPARLRHVLEMYANRASRQKVWDDVVERMCNELAAELKRELGVYCLSAVPDDILMWSHYANHHRGVCLRSSRSTGAAVFHVARQVGYSLERPVLRMIQDDPQTKLSKAFLTKAKHWDYEQEWRVLSPDMGKRGTGPGVHNWPRETFDGVILGARISQGDEATIRNFVARRPKPFTLLRAVIDAKLFKIRIEPA